MYDDTVETRKIGDVSFRPVPCDDRQVDLAHFHATTPEGEIAIELMPNGGVILSAAHGDPIKGTVTAPELKKLLDTARKGHEELLALWNATFGKKQD